jgi:hypothetical protein
MSDVRSAAAMAGCVDAEQLIHSVAKALREAKTAKELDDVWKAHVRPAYDQISETSLSILNHLYAVNYTVIQAGARSNVDAS